MAHNMSRGAGSAFGGKKFDIKKVIEWLGFVLRCPICQNKYNLNQTQVVDSEQDNGFGEAWLLIHSDCAKCKSSVMFNIEIHGPEIFSVGMVTDLTGQDSTKFQGKTPISTNEVISIHKEIKRFKGDFIGTFTEK